MTDLNFNGMTLGAGIEAFALLEEDLAAGPAEEPGTTEADVQVSIRSAEDQQDDTAADEVADDAATVADSGAELFKDLHRMYNLYKTVSKHDLSPSLYAFVNGDGQLSRIMRTSLPAVESLSSSGSNASTANMLLPKMDAYFKTDAASKIMKCFRLLTEKLNKMEVATNNVVLTRIKRVKSLIARMEEEAPEETTVEANANADDTPAETAEPVENPEAGADTLTEEAPVEAATPEETDEAVEAMYITNLKTRDLFTRFDAAINGDMAAMKDVYADVRNTTRALAILRQKAKRHRFIKLNKYEMLSSLRKLHASLEAWNVRNVMHHACRSMNKKMSSKAINGVSSFNGIASMFQAYMGAHNYLQASKKIMDAAYYNLYYLATKMMSR